MPNPHDHPDNGKACVHHPKPFIEGDADGFFIIYGENFKAIGKPKFKEVTKIVSRTSSYIWACQLVEFKNHYIDITAVPIRVAGAAPKTDGSDDVTITIEYDDPDLPPEDICVCDIAIVPPPPRKGKKKKKNGKKAAAPASPPKK